MKPRRALLVGLALAVAAHGQVAAQSWRTVTSSRQIGKERGLDVRIGYGAGRFSVRPAPAGLLYRMQIRYDEDMFGLRWNYDGGSLQLGLEGARNVRLGNTSGGSLDLELAGGVPMDLELEFGAVRADIDLGGLSLTNLSVRTGASESHLDVSQPNPSVLRRAEFQVGAADFTARRLGNLNAGRIEVSAGVGDMTIDLTGAWRQDAVVDVRMGLGSLELRLPEGLGVKLERETLLTSVDTEGMVKRGDAYYSRDWDEAERHVTIQVEAAFGSVEIVWVR